MKNLAWNWENRGFLFQIMEHALVPEYFGVCHYYIRVQLTHLQKVVVSYYSAPACGGIRYDAFKEGRHKRHFMSSMIFLDSALLWKIKSRSKMLNSARRTLLFASHEANRNLIKYVYQENVRWDFSQPHIQRTYRYRCQVEQLELVWQKFLQIFPIYLPP